MSNLAFRTIILVLALMSVFWDEGRAALEEFCRESRRPSKGEASPFNYFIEPSPNQLLRVCVGVAFKRARFGQKVYVELDSFVPS